MPAVAAMKDECLTAEDVRRRAQEVQRRRIGLRAIPVRQMQAEIRPPSPRPVEKPELRVTVHFGYPLLPIENYNGFRMTVIQKACCRAADISLGEMLSQARRLPIVRARDVAILLCKMIGPAGTSTPMLGRRFGGRDHTTILHSLRKQEPVRLAVLSRVPEGAPLHEYVSAAFDAWDHFFGERWANNAIRMRERAIAAPRNERGDWIKK